MLTGKEIKRLIGTGQINISDYDEKRVNPNSYNLRIGNKIGYYPMNEYHEYASHDIDHEYPIYYLDSKKENEMEVVTIPDDGIILTPGMLYLASTMEKVKADGVIPCISGRSSMARLGIEIHRTAGFGDIGADMKWTLEITVVHPVKIYPGQELCQIYFEYPDGEYENYHGKYQGSETLVKSRSFMDK
nr:MAG TPA: dCTP deaminase dUTPase [Caudoviricetes sp.]